MARILIVDDSPSQLLGIQRIVEKLGHQILTATDGAAGVETAKAELPDLVLMDVVMPNLNGFQATRTLARARFHPQGGVIILEFHPATSIRFGGAGGAAPGSFYAPAMLRRRSCGNGEAD